MSEKNGERIIKVTTEGRCAFQFGGDDDGVCVRLDVIAVYNQWIGVDAPFRGENDRVPPEKLAEHNQASWGFVRQLILEAAGAADQERAAQVCDRLTLTSAMAFIKHLIEEGERLIPFFSVSSAGARSSPGNINVISST